MSTAIIYWSGTGNTKEMVDIMLTKIQADSFFVTDAPKDLSKYDTILFGCPSMGAEQLEDLEFEPYYNEVVNSLKGKKIGLFGSYGWGNGEWMEQWQEDAVNAGLTVVATCIINEFPDDEAKTEILAFVDKF